MVMLHLGRDRFLVGVLARSVNNGGILLPERLTSRSSISESIFRFVSLVTPHSCNDPPVRRWEEVRAEVGIIALPLVQVADPYVLRQGILVARLGQNMFICYH